MSVMVTSIGDAWYLAHRLDDGTLQPFGDPIASLRVACQMAARMNARRAA